jgi:hypothetical protein
MISPSEWPVWSRDSIGEVVFKIWLGKRHTTQGGIVGKITQGADFLHRMARVNVVAWVTCPEVFFKTHNGVRPVLLVESQIPCGLALFFREGSNDLLQQVSIQRWEGGDIFCG